MKYFGIACFLYVLHFVTSGAALSPIILVPGDGGSRLQAKLNKTKVVSHFCVKTTSDFVDFWVSLEEFTPVSLPCFADNLQLIYDTKKHKTFDSPGVTVRAPGFGATEDIAWLESYHIYLTSYFAPIIDMLSKKLGYKPNATVFGAPYDWRRAINEQSVWFGNLTTLVEKAYSTNNNTQVTLVAHSMGNMMTLYWLHNRPEAWKKKYIKRFVALSGPWGGTIKPVRALVAGDYFGIFAMTPLTVRSAQRSLPSTHFLMSSPQYWNSSRIIASNLQKNYTLDTLKELYTDLNITNQWQMFMDSRNLLNPMTPPNVEVHCVHGINLPTPYKFTWNDKYKWPDAQPLVENGNGDGTVVLPSLAGCLKWQGKQKQPVHYHTIDKVEHLAALSNPDVLNYLYKVLSSDTVVDKKPSGDVAELLNSLKVQPVNL